MSPTTSLPRFNLDPIFPFKNFIFFKFDLAYQELSIGRLIGHDECQYNNLAKHVYGFTTIVLHFDQFQYFEIVIRISLPVENTNAALFKYKYYMDNKPKCYQIFWLEQIFW